MKKFIKKYLFIIAFIITATTRRGFNYIVQPHGLINFISGLIIFILIASLLLFYSEEQSSPRSIDANDDIEQHKVIKLFKRIRIISLIIIIFFITIGTLHHFELI